jgi:Na+/proline symporter
MEMFFTILTLALYGAGMIFLTYRFVQNRQSMEYYNVADRKNGSLQSSLSIAATWIWAPALFVASTQAYNNGWVGLFWFLVPNVLTLLFMIPFAKRLRDKFPDGFTLSAFMGKVHGKPVQRLYQGEMGLLSILSIAVNILAGSTVITMISGIPFWVASLILVGIVFAYTLKHGIKSSLLTDAVQMVLILGALALFVPFAIANKGWDSLTAGLQGINGVDGLFTESGIGVALTFGIISAIGLFAGPIGDQSFWQRVFATEKSKIGKAFGFGAFFFALVPLSMATFGFIAAGSGVEVTNPGYVNLEVIQSIFPAWVIVPFLIMLLSGLLSTVDSQMLALSSLATDYTGKLAKQRATMVIGGIAAVLIANIPGNSVLIMFMIYGTLRASTLLITVLTLLDVRLNGRAVAVGIATAMAVGFPFFIWGNLANLADVKLWGSIGTVLASGTIAYIGTKIADSRRVVVEPVKEKIAA